MRGISINIERIILNDFNVRPERLERIRKLLEAGLREKFKSDKISGSINNIEISNLSGTAVSLNKTSSDFQIASDLSESIIRVIRNKD